ncbi:MAG: ribosome-associated translation inhibitor RaiA [Ignavibacteria bacterium]
MNIQITSRKFKAKEPLKNFIHAELNSLAKLNSDIQGADVILSFENVVEETKIAEIILQIPGKTCTAKEASEDFGKSIALAVQKIEKQLIKIKSRKVDNKRTDKVLEKVEEESTEENEV